MDPTFQDFGEDEGHAPFDLKVLVLYGVFRSKLWVVGLTGVGLFFGLLVGAAAPNEYQSEARLRYVPGERTRMTEDQLAGIETGDRRGAAPGLTDEIMLLENDLIYQRVARRLGASRVLEPPDPEQYDSASTSWPVRILHKLQKALIEAKGPYTIDDSSEKAHRAAWRKLAANTTLATVRNAATIRVLHRASSAERAQEFCGALVEAFQERHREVFSAEARLESQQQKVEEAREKYTSLEQEWNDYRQECGVFDYDEDNQANQQALRSLAKTLEEKEGERQKLLAQIKVFENRLGEIKEFVEERTDPVMQENPKFADLSKNIASIEKELLLLVEGSLPASVLKQRRDNFEGQLKNLRAELEDVEPTIVVIPARTEQRKNPEYYDTHTRLTELKADRDGVIASIEHLRQQQESLQGRRKLIASCRDKHFMHAALVDAAQIDLTTQQDQLAKLEKLALAEMKGASALKPVWEPTLPLTKIGPSRTKPLVVGFALGALFGLMVAVLRQLVDRRLRYPETLEKSLGLRVIGVVPEVRRLRGLRNGTHSQSAA